MARHQTYEDSHDDCILYELLVYAEWEQEPEYSKTTKLHESLSLSGASQPSLLWRFFSYVWRRDSLADDVQRLLLHQLPWQFAVGEGGKVVAILQETLLEIRITRDEYSSVVGKAVVLKDPFPQWRKLAWSPDSNMLAIAHSSGSVSFYDLLGSNIFTIFPPKDLYDAKSPNTCHPVAAILFLQSRIKNPKWSNEVVLVDYHGHLTSYLVSPTDGYQENHGFSFTSHYRQGVAAVSYHPSHNLLFVAGSEGLYSEDGIKEFGCSMGLSAWRVLNGYPYYRLALSTDEEEAMLHAQRSLWSWMPAVRSKTKKSMIFKMQISPKGKFLACLHTCGAISVWHLPGIRLYRFWRLHDQPDFDAKNPTLSGFHKRRFRSGTGDACFDFHPVDINWWSDRAMIIARYSGAVSVCTVTNLCNLLGESPEFLAGQPQVSSMCNDRGFLGLECESVLATMKRHLDDISGSAALDTESSDDDDEDGSLMNKSSAIFQSAVYMITDMERFQPKRKRPKVIFKTYRLLGLKSTTPEELYARKIDNEEYGDALDLARTYNLDCDLVYQRQWRNSKVSINTIRDYLSKITKRSWVLTECVQRVPESFDAAQELLEFGLRGTNLETLLAIGEGTDGGHFVLRSPKVDDDMPLDEAAVKLHAAQRTQELLTKIDVHNLTEEQLDLLRYRHKLLQYLDMLGTYEKIEGETRMSEIMYKHAFYDKFRSESVITSTVEFAREGRWHAVKSMFTYHGATVLPHWLPILSNFPETTNPNKYETLLPECDSDGTVLQWRQLSLREQDWSERDDFQLALEIECDNGENVLYEHNPDLQQFRCPVGAMTPEILSQWYMNRIYQIESCSCMVDHALTLVKLAQARNILGLDNLYNQLVTLEALVYDVHLEEGSLVILRKLSDLEQAKLLMSKSAEGTFVEDVRRILLPYLVRREHQNQGSKMQILRAYLLDLSTRDLAMPLQLFEHLHIEQPNALAHWEETVDLALDCLYTYPNADQLDNAFKILACISDRNLSFASHISSSLQARLNELERDLHAASILKKSGLPKPVTYIRDCKVHANIVQQLLIKLARTVARQVPPPNTAQWDQLLHDLLTLQEKVFHCISLEICYEIFAETLLSSGNISNILTAADILEVSKINKSFKKVSFDRSVALVLQVAREYFDSSGSLLDPSMELAKACLHLIADEDEDIQENLDLIASLQMLSDFGLTLLPLHVRQCSERLRLVEASIQKRPKAYRNSQRLLQLAQKLRVAGNDSRQREGKVLSIIAETALEEKDYEYCADMCKQLVEQRHDVGWEVVQRLGQCQDFTDLELRQSLLAFALLHCSPDVMETLIDTRCLLEAEVLHEAINSQVDTTAIEEEEFSDALTSPATPQKEFPPLSGLVLSVEQSAEVVKRTTYSLIENVSNKDFWKTTLRWGWETDASTADGDEDEPFSLQGFPTFYASLSPGCHASRLTTNYDRFSGPNFQDRMLQIYQAMLRSVLLEECATLKCSREINSAVFSQLAQHLLPEDCSLGLAHLLIARDEVQTDRCFSNLPFTSLSLQVAVYYYALEGYQALLHSGIESKPLRDIYLLPPSQLVNSMMKSASTMETPGCWVEPMKHYQNLLADYLQGQQLQASGCGVDLQRFTDDVQYRRDSILGLAMTIDKECFQLAINLGARHGVPEGQIAAVHVSALFLSGNEISLSQLSSRLNEPHLLKLLLSQPHEVCDRMTHYVYPSICGTEHQLLILYYGVLNSVAEHYVTNSLPSREHIKLLKKVKATSPGIDYKKLIENPTDVLEVLRPALTKESVGLVAKLLKSLPDVFNCCTKPGAIYSIWAQMEFFQVQTKEDSVNVPPGVWFQQYEICCKHFGKMAAADLISFAKGVLFSEQSLQLMSIECRKQILTKIREYCLQQINKQIDSNLCKEWSETVETVESWFTHLETLYPEKAHEINAQSDPHLTLLLQQLDLSRGEAGPVLQMLQSAVLSPISYQTLEMLVQLFPQPSPTLKQLLEDLLNIAIAGIRSGQEPEALSLLPAVLQRMQEGVDQGGPSSDSPGECSLLWKQLEPLCADTNLTPEIRLQALSLLQSLEVMPEDTNGLLLFHHTQAAVALAWPSSTITFQESELALESSRYKLFEQLQMQTVTWQQICTLKGLLDKWPAFENLTFRHNLNNPWLQCVQKVLHFEGGDPDEIIHMLNDIFKRNDFAEECLQELVAQAEGCTDLPPLLLVCLLSDHASLHRKAASLILQYYHSGDPPLRPWLCTLLIQKGLLPSLVSTPVYWQLTQHLLGDGEESKKLAAVNSVCAQLVASGSVAEAGTLQMLQMGTPPSLTVFSTALLFAKRMSAEE